MYDFEVPATIKLIFVIFYRVKFWRRDDVALASSKLDLGRQIFIILYYMSFVASIGIGSRTTSDKDQTIFLTVMTIVASVHNYRIWLIVRNRKLILKFVNEIGVYYTKNRIEFDQIDNKLKLFMRFGDCFMIITCIAMGSIAVLFPIINLINGERRMFFNNAFPMDWAGSDMAFWLAFFYVTIGMFLSAVCCSLILILWYLMLSLVFRYEILKNQMKNLGMLIVQDDKNKDGLQLNISIEEHQSLYMKDLMMAILTYNNINGRIEDFAATFSNMFFLQTATSAVCLCGSIYNLAFISHTDLVQDGVSCVIVAFLIFDIFVVMYLGNEIKLASDNLSYCLFESSWIKQSRTGKKWILILKERLKRPQELIVGKLYPLNLETFTSIIKGTYSLFNILLNFRE